MSTTLFHTFWNKRYPESVPLGHHLRDDYPDRWFRILSLPESKRYADDDDERRILLYRQNTLITDLLGDQANFYIVTGRYDGPAAKIAGKDKTNDDPNRFRKLGLRESEAINLSERYPKEYDESLKCYFIPASIVATWQSGKFDDLLLEMADGEAHAVLLGLTRSIAVCPYDGGVDCIVEDSNQVAFYKYKYQNWLSRLESGL